jgi:hypothetical protein
MPKQKRFYMSEEQRFMGKKVRVWVDKTGHYHPNMKGRGIDEKYTWSSDAFVDAKHEIARRAEEEKRWGKKK